MSVSDIITAICSELVKVMGPIAPIVISEKVKSLNADSDDLPMDKIAQLVESLSYEIHDEKNRAEFQKGALKQIKQFAAHAGV